MRRTPEERTGVAVPGLSADRRLQPIPERVWGDDVGYYNASAYNQGMMGYKTPNLDSIAKEGALFTDMYAQQSCMSGHACRKSTRV